MCAEHYDGHCTNTSSSLPKLHLTADSLTRCTPLQLRGEGEIARLLETELRTTTATLLEVERGHANVHSYQTSLKVYNHGQPV